MKFSTGRYFTGFFIILACVAFASPAEAGIFARLRCKLKAPCCKPAPACCTPAPTCCPAPAPTCCPTPAPSCCPAPSSCCGGSVDVAPVSDCGSSIMEMGVIIDATPIEYGLDWDGGGVKDDPSQYTGKQLFCHNACSQCDDYNACITVCNQLNANEPAENGRYTAPPCQEGTMPQ